MLIDILRPASAVHHRDSYALKEHVFDLVDGAGLISTDRDFLFGLDPISSKIIMRFNDIRATIAIKGEARPVPEVVEGTEYDFCVIASPMRRSDSGGKRVKVHDLDHWRRTHLDNIGATILTECRREEQRWVGKPPGFFVPAVTFVGRLRVDDVTRFVPALRHGIGRHRGFGFGLMQIFPV
jgi:hypothetical protein